MLKFLTLVTYFGFVMTSSFLMQFWVLFLNIFLLSLHCSLHCLNFHSFHLVFNLYCFALVFFFLFIVDFDMGFLYFFWIRYGFQIWSWSDFSCSFILMFTCIYHYFFHYSIWDSLIFSIFSQWFSIVYFFFLHFGW